MAQPPLLNHSMSSPRRRAHRRAPDDVASLNPNRIEVAGDAEERPEWVSDGNSLANDGVVDAGKEDVGDRSDGLTKKTGRLIPFLYRRDQSIEQLLNLPSKLHRPAIVHGQSWNDVLPTRLTFKSVSSLLKECRAHGFEIIIPRPDQRPWPPPIGFQCVYETFFQQDSKLWIPIPHLITSYCARRDIAMTQLMTGAVRIAIALMVMAVEIDISMSVRAFEELTQIQPRPGGVYAVQMCSGLIIHPNTIRPLDTFCKDVPKVVVLSQQHWESFDRRRINRQQKRTEETKGKRLKLPLMGKTMKSYPNYSDILDAQLGGESFSAMTTAEVKDSDAR
ncbi:hypothetical protein F2Q68_00015074 [Brassica cretica]|uniref:Uncharacterized protein n=1 Tax=Brassica cretica TaxID=69181 RepID=A0A8S9HGC7_BRACR|nr:hypothetical protein F2Q68_00015074 [Brassica cretica]